MVHDPDFRPIRGLENLNGCESQKRGFIRIGMIHWLQIWPRMQKYVLKWWSLTQIFDQSEGWKSQIGGRDQNLGSLESVSSTEFNTIPRSEQIAFDPFSPSQFSINQKPGKLKFLAEPQMGARLNRYVLLTAHPISYRKIYIEQIVFEPKFRPIRGPKIKNSWKKGLMGPHFNRSDPLSA